MSGREENGISVRSLGWRSRGEDGPVERLAKLTRWDYMPWGGGV